MQIISIEVGELKTNCYLLKKNNKVLIIDLGDDVKKILAQINVSEKVVGILVTHFHYDHISALVALEEKFNVIRNQFDQTDFQYKIIKTPGHSEDSLTFYFEKDKVMFTGDFIFYHTIGRFDFLGGNLKSMKKSLALIETYPDDITIYPGHGTKTCLAEEKIYFSKYLEN